jgi:hypothetical protein
MMSFMHLSSLFLIFLFPHTMAIITSLDDLRWSDDKHLLENYVLYLDSSCQLELNRFYVHELPTTPQLLSTFDLQEAETARGTHCVAIGLLQGPVIFSPHLS